MLINLPRLHPLSRHRYRRSFKNDSSLIFMSSWIAASTTHSCLVRFKNTAQCLFWPDCVSKATGNYAVTIDTTAPHNQTYATCHSCMGPLLAKQGADSGGTMASYPPLEGTGFDHWCPSVRRLTSRPCLNVVYLYSLCVVWERSIC